jgi:hypothetical protein
VCEVVIFYLLTSFRERTHNGLVYRVRGSIGFYRYENAAVGVVLKNGFDLVVETLEPPFDHRFVRIVATPRVGTTRDACARDVVRNDEMDHRVGAENGVRTLGLGRCAREPFEDEAARRRSLRERIAYRVDDQVVRDELTAVQGTGNLPSGLGVIGREVSQQIAG